MPRKVHPINLDQKFKIQAILARRLDAGGKRLTMASLARELGEPAASVATTIYNSRPGTAKTRELQEKIAAYLELPAAELFEGNGHAEKSESQEAPAAELPPITLGQKIKRAFNWRPARNEN